MSNLFAHERYVWIVRWHGSLGAIHLLIGLERRPILAALQLDLPKEGFAFGALCPLVTLEVHRSVAVVQVVFRPVEVVVVFAIVECVVARSAKVFGNRFDASGQLMRVDVVADFVIAMTAMLMSPDGCLHHARHGSAAHRRANAGRCVKAIEADSRLRQRVNVWSFR